MVFTLPGFLASCLSLADKPHEHTIDRPFLSGLAPHCARDTRADGCAAAISSSLSEAFTSNKDPQGDGEGKERCHSETEQTSGGDSEAIATAEDGGLRRDRLSA
jgi:hypothetical protein